MPKQIRGWMWYYLFVDVISSSIGELLIQSDDLIQVQDSCQGVFMFVNHGVFSSLHEAIEDFGCGPLARLADEDEIQLINSQFKIKV